MNTQTFIVTGDNQIHCTSCEARISRALKRISGVVVVTARSQTQEVRVMFNPRQTSADAIRARLEALGYRVGPHTS